MGIISDWVNRQRHNKGYGIQSPSEFFFVTQVLKERLPYYAYELLETIATEEMCNVKHLKELFRITNHHKPTNCIAVCSATAACAMATARPSAANYCITRLPISKKTQTILANYNCNTTDGDTAKQLNITLQKLKEVGILYIGICAEHAELLETALRYTKENSIIVIEGIHSSKEVHRWWNSIVERKETIVTYDMSSYGILYFNKQRCKQHYTLKL